MGPNLAPGHLGTAFKIQRLSTITLKHLKKLCNLLLVKARDVSTAIDGRFSTLKLEAGIRAAWSPDTAASHRPLQESGAPGQSPAAAAEDAMRISLYVRVVLIFQL